jgi:hypothetical protein
MSRTDFEGCKGILYYSAFKPSEPYGISDGIFIVPSGWEMVPLPQSVGSIRMCRSHFVMPTDWSEKVAWERFRDWVIFDSFVLTNSMSSLASTLFDNNVFARDRATYSVYQGSKGDKSDRFGEGNYNDVIHILVGAKHKPENLSSVTYAALYDTFRSLTAEAKSAIEWFVSPPPSPRRFDDAFFGNYWGLLHITILIENIIGLPPYCEHQLEECKICGIKPPRHYKVSRRDWLREGLETRVADTKRVEEYATLIETAYKIRNRMSHGPVFDRSSLPTMTHGQTEVYDVDRAVKQFKQNSHALSAILSNLRKITHALLVDQAFGIKYFAPFSFATFTIRGSVSVESARSPVVTSGGDLD